MCYYYIERRDKYTIIRLTPELSEHFVHINPGKDKEERAIEIIKRVPKKTPYRFEKIRRQLIQKKIMRKKETAKAKATL